MTHELEPLVRLLDMTDEGDVHWGKAGTVEVVAFVSNIGMAAGLAAAEQALLHDVDHVMVVGIAGGVDHSLSIGDLVVPETVVDRAAGTKFTPTGSGTITPRGILSCGDDLIVDAAAIAKLEAEGVTALDMETAAVAAVCQRDEMPWSVYRGISDMADGGLIDAELFAMTTPDGGADPDAMAKYLEAHPEKADVFTQLANDMKLATEAAAVAAIAACTT